MSYCKKKNRNPWGKTSDLIDLLTPVLSNKVNINSLTSKCSMMTRCHQPDISTREVRESRTIEKKLYPTSRSRTVLLLNGLDYK